MALAGIPSILCDHDLVTVRLTELSAIGFSYFETMIQLFDKQQIENEGRRISDLNQYILTAGSYDISLFEDMVEETVLLLKDIAQNIANRDVAMAVLMERFNDRSCSNAIIYHLRLLASSWLKENPAHFEPFIPDDVGIAGYCQDFLERPDREIEHLGIVLLTNVLLKPVNFVLEIAYLDRSPGSQVNTYRFPPEANEQESALLGPFIHLLFRPDHYDILYRPLAKPISIQVHKVTTCKHDNSVLSNGPQLNEFSEVDFSTLALMPNLAHGGFAAPSAAAIGEAYLPTGTTAWLGPPYTGPVQPPAPALPPPPTQLPPPTQPAPTSPATTYPLRFSREMHRLTTDPFMEPPTFTTNMFKNSHFNKAHYNNPEFHPEEWTPDDDVPEKGGSGRKKGRGKQE
jgi:ubiquitin thioesterase protein OTUB1